MLTGKVKSYRYKEGKAEMAGRQERKSQKLSMEGGLPNLKLYFEVSTSQIDPNCPFPTSLLIF